ncbi:inositol monophosphatase [Pontibacillus halophilus JSM 076056 = DSM 19796]|uniref:inositol-phosphate phosphatase n=1 Tax=Pontibacillus halophilus JSM 076056 = DSM 19796 TaxID=1385510 RepID=A0A0A5GMT9_9BACI|nr:inositol monophosphatase family protein [Pontibacillus halophilus]KGX93314.1 inositol monophosphatase [Pontibacillus halophilus JSM 076056 = DSM 19796]
MRQADRQALYDQAKQWVLEAGEAIRTSIHKPLRIETKSSPNDLVTEMDEQTERFFAQHIHETYPEHKVLGEEGLGDELDDLTGTVWIVDPIDGTMNFVHQKQNFAISVGIYQDGVGEIGFIYDVMADVLFHAKRGEGAYKNDQPLPNLDERDVQLEAALIGLNNFWTTENPRVETKGIHALVRKARGTRSYGSAALEFAYLAEGIMDGYVTMKLAPWDIAAGMILLSEVGGITTRADGRTVNLLQNNSIIAAHPNIHEELYRDYIILKNT